MEAAIRWSPYSTKQKPRFLIIDVMGNRLRLCQIELVDNNKVKYKQLCQRDKLPNFTAFDWSKRDEHLVGIGSASGEATIVQIDADRPQSDFIHAFPIKHQRKCNSLAFSPRNYLATGLDRVRNDFCMNIYDLNVSSLSTIQEPYRKLASSEAITSIKFFSREPDTLIAGVSRQCIRLYDLRGTHLNLYYYLMHAS
jgi:WD repeat-containing protein mio